MLIQVSYSFDQEVEEISLPIALHSPLFVLKEQLAAYTNISIPNQVLILKDLSDKGLA